MLKLLQQVLVNAAVVRGETVMGYVDHLEIDESGVYIILEDEPETPASEEVDFKLDTAEIVALARKVS